MKLRLPPDRSPLVVYAGVAARAALFDMIIGLVVIFGVWRLGCLLFGWPVPEPFTLLWVATLGGLLLSILHSVFATLGRRTMERWIGGPYYVEPDHEDVQSCDCPVCAGVVDAVADPTRDVFELTTKRFRVLFPNGAVYKARSLRPAEIADVLRLQAMRDSIIFGVEIDPNIYCHVTKNPHDPSQESEERHE